MVPLDLMLITDQCKKKMDQIYLEGNSTKLDSRLSVYKRKVYLNCREVTFVISKHIMTATTTEDTEDKGWTT